jgi:hypothetical protein
MLHFAGRPPLCCILGCSGTFPIPTASGPHRLGLPRLLQHRLLRLFPGPPPLFLPLLSTRRPLQAGSAPPPVPSVASLPPARVPRGIRLHLTVAASWFGTARERERPIPPRRHQPRRPPPLQALKLRRPHPRPRSRHHRERRPGEQW